MKWRISAEGKESFRKYAIYPDGGENRENPLYLFKLWRGFTLDIKFNILTQNEEVVNPDFTISLRKLRDLKGSYQLNYPLLKPNDDVSWWQLRIVMQGHSLTYDNSGFMENYKDKGKLYYRDKIHDKFSIWIYLRRIIASSQYELLYSESIGAEEDGWFVMQDEGLPGMMDEAYIELSFAPEIDRMIMIDWVKTYPAPLHPINCVSESTIYDFYDSLEVENE